MPAAAVALVGGGDFLTGVGDWDLLLRNSCATAAMGVFNSRCWVSSIEVLKSCSPSCVECFLLAAKLKLF